MAQQLLFVVDLDERGSFKAHVEDAQLGNVVFELSNENPDTGWPDEDGLWLVNDGFMRHTRDVDGLHEYLVQAGLVSKCSPLQLSH